MLYSFKGGTMIEIEGLSKAFHVAKRRDSGLKSYFSRDYEKVHAIQDVSFHVKRGEMVGYIGPNGAGKSTTIKIMSGILRPTAGTCKVDGIVPWKSRKKHVQNIGVVFGQKTQLWWDVPVIDSFSLLKSIYKIPSDQYQKNFNELVEILNLSNSLNTPVRQLSLGQRMRAEIAASLIHSPKLLFLDEPTIGLDAASKLAVREFIKQLNAKNETTVVLTTHDMQDIEALTDRIILIGKGKKLYDGALESMKRNFISSKKVIVDYIESDERFNALGCKILKEKRGYMELEVDLNQTSVPAVIDLLTRQFEILDLSVQSQPIEETVLNLYEKYEVI